LGATAEKTGFAVAKPGKIILQWNGLGQRDQQHASMQSLLLLLLASSALVGLLAYSSFREAFLRPLSIIRKTALHRRPITSGNRMLEEVQAHPDSSGNDFELILKALVDGQCREDRMNEDLRQLQQHLEQAKAELACMQFALDHHVIVSITDVAGRILYVNDKFCEISQYSREELIGSNHRIVNSKHHPKSFWVQMWQAVMRGEVWHAEVCNRSKDGEVYWVDTTIVPYAHDQGKITKLISLRSDITARKKAETELEANRNRYELAVRGSNDGIWDWNITTSEVYYSPRFIELLGYSTDVFPPHIKTFRSHLHPSDVGATWGAIQRHLETGETFDVYCRIRHVEDGWRWFRIKGAAIRNEEGVAQRMAGSISDISKLKSAEERLAREALIDGLTGLPNRTLFLNRLQVAVRQAAVGEQSYAVLFLDFDRFKLINDCFGHEAGDELLRQIAWRLRLQVSMDDSVHSDTLSDTCARLGGDEFVVLLRSQSELFQVLPLVQELLTILSAPYNLNGREVYSTASIGVLLGNATYEKAEDVLRDADTAMYEAKHSGKSCFVVFDEGMRERASRRHRLEHDLHRVIEASQLSLVYQPIMDLSSGGIHSIEVLCRWNHPTLGPISPLEFIPIAEDAGLIANLTDWVIATAFQEFVAWRRDLGAKAPQILCLNISSRQFGQNQWIDHLQGMLTKFQIDPTCLELELSERAIRDDLANATQTLLRLKKLGIRVALDDYGLGATSFMTLHDLPMDSLKIDRSLLVQLPRSKEAAALVHGLIVIARGLGVRLVSEGIENEEQLKILRDLGCQLMQGNLFSPPLSAEDCRKFLRQSSPSYSSSTAAMVTVPFAPTTAPTAAPTYS
jgi:diguanylate cyclase (GGDEF)-like protein/PAS domain S-box-containing protein